MDDHTVMRDGQRPLSFAGELLGSSSTHRPGKMRWLELAIYAPADTSGYVVAGVGRSVVPGETDRCWAYVEETPEDVIRRLERYEDGTDTRYLTRAAAQAIQSAAESDESLREAFYVGVAATG